MATTLRDVAAHAGVSIRTVSNVVSGYTHVSTDTRNRVLASISELDYHANPVARTLRTGRTGVFLLAVPEIDVPYFSELAKEVIRAAAAHAYSITITQTNDIEPSSDGHFDKRAVLYDGVLVASHTTPRAPLPIAASPSTPIVLLGEDATNEAHDRVAIDNVLASYEATTHIVSLGRKRIGVIGTQPQLDFSTPAHRFAGYCKALADAGIAFDQALVAPTAHYSRKAGYEAARSLLTADHTIDAIVCFSDLLAIGALRAARDLSRSIPEELSIVGIDDIPEGRFSTPSLTTVSLDIASIASNSIRLLLSRLEDPNRPPEEFIAPHRLIVRESCGGHDQRN